MSFVGEARGAAWEGRYTSLSLNSLEDNKHHGQMNHLTHSAGRTTAKDGRQSCEIDHSCARFRDVVWKSCSEFQELSTQLSQWRNRQPSLTCTPKLRSCPVSGCGPVGVPPHLKTWVIWCYQRLQIRWTSEDLVGQEKVLKPLLDLMGSQ